MIENLRIGSVPYLNAKPLVHYLPESINLIEPSLLARKFSEGLFDVALVPVVECFLEEGVKIVDELAIACQGPVYSVILAHEKPVVDLKSISLDAASLSSVTLLKVLLKQYWKIDPVLLDDGKQAEAQLLIGDRAIQFRNDFPQACITDLGMAWRSYTGLPFVFAVWAIHSQSIITPEQIVHFRELSRKGLSAKRAIAQTPEEFLYLSEWIRHGLGPFEKEAINRFALEIKSLGLLGQRPVNVPPFV